MRSTKVLGGSFSKLNGAENNYSLPCTHGKYEKLWSVALIWNYSICLEHYTKIKYMGTVFLIWVAKYPLKYFIEIDSPLLQMKFSVIAHCDCEGAPAELQTAHSTAAGTLYLPWYLHLMDLFLILKLNLGFEIHCKELSQQQ